MWKRFASRWVVAAPWVYGGTALVLAMVFGAVAVASSIASMGAFALVLAGVGLWNISVGVRVLRASRRGATPVSHLVGGSSEGAGFAAPATRSGAHGSQTGVVVIVGEDAAFIPTSEWRGAVVTLAASARVSNVVMLNMPQSVAELHALMESTGGFYLDSAWRWSVPGFTLSRVGYAEVVSVRLGEPHRSRWERTQADAGQKRRAWIALGISSLVSMALLGVAMLIWQHTGDIEHLQGCGCYAMFPAVAGVIAFFILGGLRPAE